MFTLFPVILAVFVALVVLVGGWHHSKLTDFRCMTVNAALQHSCVYVYVCLPMYACMCVYINGFVCKFLAIYSHAFVFSIFRL